MTLARYSFSIKFCFRCLWNSAAFSVDLAITRTPDASRSNLIVEKKGGGKGKGEKEGEGKEGMGREEMRRKRGREKWRMGRGDIGRKQ